MPNKMRLLLMTPNREMMHGSQVVAMLCKMVQKNLKSLVLPNNWLTLTTKARLEFLASQMPKGYEFAILREPTRTRRSKSAYVRAIHARNGGEFFSAPRINNTTELWNGLNQGFTVAAPTTQTTGNGIRWDNEPPQGIQERSIAITTLAQLERRLHDTSLDIPRINGELMGQWLSRSTQIAMNPQSSVRQVNAVRSFVFRFTGNLSLREMERYNSNWGAAHMASPRPAATPAPLQARTPVPVPVQPTLPVERPSVADLANGVPPGALVVSRNFGGHAIRYNHNGRFRDKVPAMNNRGFTWRLEPLARPSGPR